MYDIITYSSCVLDWYKIYFGSSVELFVYRMEALVSPCTDKTIPHTIHILYNRDIESYTAMCLYCLFSVQFEIYQISIREWRNTFVCSHVMAPLCYAPKIGKVFRKYKTWGIVIGYMACWVCILLNICCMCNFLCRGVEVRQWK